MRHERGHGAADALNPCARDAIGITIKEHRHNLFGERLIKIRAVHAILLGDVVGMGILADGETVGAIVTFAPPAVEDAQVHAAVAAGLHAARAGSFERAARVVQPDVAAGNHLARDVNVVIFDEDKIAREFAVFAQMDNLLDETLAFVIARMRLARKDELHGALLVFATV